MTFWLRTWQAARARGSMAAIFLSFRSIPVFRRHLTFPWQMGWPWASRRGSMSSTTYSMCPPWVQMLLKGERQNTGAVISQCCRVSGSVRWMVVPTRVQTPRGLGCRRAGDVEETGKEHGQPQLATPREAGERPRQVTHDMPPK